MADFQNTPGQEAENLLFVKDKDRFQKVGRFLLKTITVQIVH
jgi:hypothetical protein